MSILETIAENAKIHYLKNHDNFTNNGVAYVINLEDICNFIPHSEKIYHSNIFLKFLHFEKTYFGYWTTSTTYSGVDEDKILTSYFLNYLEDKQEKINLIADDLYNKICNGKIFDSAEELNIFLAEQNNLAESSDNYVIYNEISKILPDYIEYICNNDNKTSNVCNQLYHHIYNYIKVGIFNEHKEFSNLVWLFKIYDKKSFNLIIEIITGLIIKWKNEEFHKIILNFSIDNSISKIIYNKLNMYTQYDIIINSYDLINKISNDIYLQYFDGLIRPGKITNKLTELVDIALVIEGLICTNENFTITYLILCKDIISEEEVCFKELEDFDCACKFIDQMKNICTSGEFKLIKMLTYNSNTKYLKNILIDITSKIKYCDYVNYKNEYIGNKNCTILEYIETNNDVKLCEILNKVDNLIEKSDIESLLYKFYFQHYKVYENGLEQNDIWKKSLIGLGNIYKTKSIRLIELNNLEDY